MKIRINKKIWIGLILAAIVGATGEYNAGATGGSPLQASNRRQNLRTFFKRTGVELCPRNPAKINDIVGAGSKPALAIPWKFTWQTEYFGRPGALKRVSEIEPKVVGATRRSPSPNTGLSPLRVEYNRPDISEWYTNEPKGIEQGFVIHKRPVGATRRSPRPNAGRPGRMAGRPGRMAGRPM